MNKTEDRKVIEKKIEKVLRTHIKGFNIHQTTTGLIRDLTDLYISSIKKRVNVALHEEKKRRETNG